MRNWIDLCEMIESEDPFSAPPPAPTGPHLDIHQIQWVKIIRHVCRVDNGGGGACHLVSEAIESCWGLERVEGTVTSADGRIICSHHLWNEFPDGTILDATADQFGEEDIRFITPSDPSYHTYQIRWGSRRHVEDDEVDALIAFADEEEKRAEKIDKEFGDMWWLGDRDRTLLNYYRSENEKYKNGAYDA